MLADKTLEMPKPDSSGCLIPTLNNTGYMTTQLDPYSEKFVRYAAEAKGPVLEIGAAYGIATLAALAQGAEMICNDMDPRHLAILRENAEKMKLENLTTVLGVFPEELNFPKESVEGILIARVLHFFEASRLEHALEKAYEWLKPGGKIFIVAETPYLKRLSAFIPEYERRVARGEPWPGLIEDVYQYVSDEVIPKLMNFMDPTVLSRVLQAQGFEIEEVSFIDRSGFFPPERVLDGRESVGVIARK